MLKNKNSWIYCFIIILSSCYEEVFLPENPTPEYDYQLYFNDIQVAFDKSCKLILCPIEAEDLDGWEVKFTSDEVEILEIDGNTIDNEEYYFNVIKAENRYPITLKMSDNKTEHYSLQFTTLPVFQVFTDNYIPDEPEVLAWLIISSGSDYEKVITSYIGIERRGGTAYHRPKQSYKIEFWDNEYETGHKNISFYGLIPDDDWILDAMYIDKARMRNILSFDIWEEIQKDRIPGLSVIKTGVDGGLIELFINNRLLGIYHLCERVDRKRLDIRPPGEYIEGVIYKAYDWKGPTMYTGLDELELELEWGGWELRYPKDFVNTAWYPLYYYLDFAMNSTDEDFEKYIYDYIDMGSAIDYYILLNITVAGDNWGKNIIMTRYNSTSPFLFVPWDLDGTWGRGWDSTCTSPNALLTNNLYNRLITLNPGEFKQELVARWEYLESELLYEDAINSRIEEYQALYIESGAFERERLLWPEWNLNLSDEVEYMKNWNHQRHQYLENYFSNLK